MVYQNCRSKHYGHERWRFSRLEKFM